MKSFNAGTNQLPQASPIKQSVYVVKARLKAGEETSVPYSAYEIESYDDDKKEFVVVRPTTDSIPLAQLLFGPGHGVPADKCFMATQTTDAIIASADTGLTVAVGDSLGTQTDEYVLTTGKTGFKALDYDSTTGRAMIRFEAAAGSTTLQIVQVTSAASQEDGTVTVKNVSIKSDPTASPNYELSGDAYLVNFFKE
jgi:hypothetical protein